MPYSIQTKDGIVLNNIPDDVPKDSQVLKDRVAKIRSERASGVPITGQTSTQDATGASVADVGSKANAPAPPPSQPEIQLVPSSLEEAGRQFNQNAGAAVRGAVGGATGLVTMVADPITHLLNLILPDNMKQLPPSEGLQHLLTKAGVPNPQDEAARILQSATGGLAGAGNMTEVGRSLSKEAPGLLQKFSDFLANLSGKDKGTNLQQVGKNLASNPVQQAVGGAAGAAAGQGANDAGAPFPIALGANLVAGGLAAGAVPGGVKPAYRFSSTGTATPEEVGTLVNQATGFGATKKLAQTKLAEMAAVNPDAKAAAEKLGIDLPPDVFSDNPQIREAAGLTRSVAGSEASAGWRDTVRNAADKADEIMGQFDVPFIEGRPSTAVVSSQVKNALIDSRKTLYDEAAKLSDEVGTMVPDATKANVTNLKSYLDGVTENMGGVEGLSSYEKKLLAMVDSSNTTYGRLNRERQLVGENLGKMKDQMFGDTDSRTLKDIYAAMAKDRNATVETMGNKDALQKLEASNLLFGKAFAMGDRIVHAFGQGGTGDISTDLPAAILSVGKGKGEDLQRILDIVPADLQKQAVATGLAAATRAKGGSEKGGFGFSEFSTLYPNLRANPQAYAKLVDALGPGSNDILQSLYSVSKNLTQARANVLTTGKANQALVNSMTADSLIDKVLSWAGKATVGKIPIVGEGLNDALANGSSVKLTKAAKLFNSEAFQNVMSGKAQPKSILDSPEFKVYADTVKIPFKERQQWLYSALNHQVPKTDQQYQQDAAAKVQQAISIPGVGGNP